jgi:hypothetical protein
MKCRKPLESIRMEDKNRVGRIILKPILEKLVVGI